MSNTYRDAAPHVRARRSREREQAPHLPRVVLRKPLPGDEYPLSPAEIREILHALPAEQIFKLERVELRPRIGYDVGNPFGCYFRPERTIVIYSVPPDEWFFPLRSLAQLRARVRFPEYARYRESRYGVSVHWDEPGSLARWYAEEVLMHELGHHWRNVYEATWPRGGRTKDEERVAQTRARRNQKRLKR